MSIKITRKGNQDLTIHVVTGPVSEEEMIEAINAFYNQNPTTALLWDISRAKMEHIQVSSIEAFVQHAAKLGARRVNGRTAILASSDLQFGLARMSEILTEGKIAIIYCY